MASSSTSRRRSEAAGGLRFRIHGGRLLQPRIACSASICASGDSASVVQSFREHARLDDELWIRKDGVRQVFHMVENGRVKQRNLDDGEYMIL